MLTTTKYLIATLVATLLAPAAAFASPIIDPQVVESSPPPEPGTSLVLPLAGVALVVVLVCAAVLVVRSSRPHAVHA